MTGQPPDQKSPFPTGPPAESPGGQPGGFRRSPVRVAVFGLMGLSFALTLWAKVRIEDESASGGRRVQVSTRLVFAATQSELAYLYRHFELEGADTRNRLLDRLGFEGMTSSQALADVAMQAYEAAVELDPLDVDSRVSAAVLLAYLGREQEAVQLLQSGVQAGSPQSSVLMSMLRFYSGEVPQESWAASEPVRRMMEKLPVGRLYLISLYSAMGDIEKVEQQEGRALAIGKSTAVRVFAMAGFLGLLLLVGIVTWAVLLFRGMPDARSVEPALWTAGDVAETLILLFFLQIPIGLVAMRFTQEPVALLVIPYLGAAALAFIWLWRVILVRLRLGLSAVGWKTWAASSQPAPLRMEAQAGQAPTASPKERMPAVASAKEGSFLGHALTGALGYTAALPVVAAILLGLRLWRSDLFPSNPIVPMLSQAPDWETKAAILLLAIVAAPLIEETFFRGVLYPATRRRLRPFNARLGSAFIFSVAHLDAVGFLPLLFLGAVFAYLYDRTGSLVAPTVAHALTNAISLMILLAL